MLDSVRSSTSSSSVSTNSSHSLPQLEDTLAEMTYPVKKARLPTVAVVGIGFIGKYVAHLVIDGANIHNLETLQ